ncbi:fluoride efflux transporter FluC [Curtobacterium aurantiacum]|jgi:hypothetical protein|uniref:fluoride efflux transporter FluC n=1 Tax=Curtobacterium TaxID=2034 RepID=UPI001E57EEA2|nr:CrcB family protein [Curtobacterium flaccumfaciens]
MEQAASAGAVVVGVQAGRVRDIVTVAAEIAERFKVPLVCVMVDPALLSAGSRADGSEIIEPIDPDTPDARPVDLPDADRAVIDEIASARSVQASVLTKAGDPARALASVAEERGAVPVAVLGTGVMGGYTTFSTASFETVRLARSGRITAAAANGLGMLIVSVAAATAGVLLGGTL